MIRSEIYTNDSFLYTNLAHKLVAATINAAVSPTNAVESHYKTYFDLYLAFASSNFEASTEANKDVLIELASLCPGKDGTCVYQARALYHSVFKEPLNFSENCYEIGARIANSSKNINKTSIESLNIYPNPAHEKITLSSVTEDEQISITVTDMCGKTLFSKNLTLNGTSVDLDLNLFSGVYLVQIVNAANQSFIKKLIVTE